MGRHDGESRVKTVTKSELIGDAISGDVIVEWWLKNHNCDLKSGCRQVGSVVEEGAGRLIAD